MMRAMIWIVGALLFSVSQVTSLGCGDSSNPSVDLDCSDGDCECKNVDSCSLDCVDTADCLPSCSGIRNDCAAECVAEGCEFRCHAAGNCGGVCGDDCYVACSSVDTTCRAETGDNSEFNCINSENCAVELGDDSVAVCTVVEACVVRCTGTCNVFCIDAGTCSVDCQQGDRLNCGQGHFTCGIPCP